MIEAILIAYLSQALSVPAFMEVPEDPPDRFVVVEKAGGSMTDHIFSATVAVQSWARARLYDAATLNEEVKGALLYGPVPDEITRVSLNSDYNFTDPGTGYYRYQAIYDMIHY